MKKSLVRFSALSLVFLLLLPCLLSGCNALKKFSNPNITVINQTSFNPTTNPYSLKDSFALDNGLNYYIFELGEILNVPMNIKGAPGVNFNGTETTLHFEYAQTQVDESASAIYNSLENSITLTTSTYTESSVDASLGAIFEGGLTVGIENSVSSEITSTYAASFYNSTKTESTFSQSFDYTFNKDDPRGFYFYTPIASMKIYEVVVYNSNTQKIEYMFSYSEFSPSVPGLYYSPSGFIDYTNFEIAFDESKLPEFFPPQKTVETAVSVSVNPMGANCDNTTLELSLGQPYGNLPELTKHGYDFLYWSCNGRKITSDSIVISSHPIEANWKLKTTGLIEYKSEISVSSKDKVSPLHWFVEGSNGESGNKDTNIYADFDMETLKKEGYKMNIRLECDVKHAWLANFCNGLQYKITLMSDAGKNIYTFSDGFHSDSYIHRKLLANSISLNNVNGNISFNISTENVNNLYIKNIKFYIEFVK